MIRLAHGVTAGRGYEVWAPGPDGVPVNAAEVHLAPGTPVVVAGRSCEPGELAEAIRQLKRLVDAGGEAAADASVALTPGLRSARLAGAIGDRRDGILAALRVLGAEGVARLGDRSAIVVALFGAAATKPVGAAAADAVGTGRWTALYLASAASDLLGPEQLEQVLALAEPDVPTGAHRDQALASVLAGHLHQVLGPLSGRRRLAILLDLWQVAGAQHEAARRLARLRAVQGRQDRSADLKRRYQALVDERIVEQVRIRVGREPTLAEAARWVPSRALRHTWLNQVMHDAIAATVLIRVSVSVADRGVVAGVAELRRQIDAAPLLLPAEAAAEARRGVPGLIGVPARPGSYLHDIASRLRSRDLASPATVQFIQQRLARSREYGVVVLDAATELLNSVIRLDEPVTDWTCPHLRQWREVAGYSPVRPPSDWTQPPLLTERPPLAERLGNGPEANPMEIEQPSDLLWYAELADALAQLNGHERATASYTPIRPYFDTDPTPPEPEPLRPRHHSISLALAGAAQLVSLGAEVSPQARRWTELVNDLLSAATVAEALAGAFPVPAALARLDGAHVPGTDLRLRLAHDPHTLADWANYMGNCIAGSFYLDSARRGQCVLAALCDRDGRIVVNVELLPRGARPGWKIGELQARFNTDPDPELAGRIAGWLAKVPSSTRRLPTPRRPHPRRPSRHERRVRVIRYVGAELDDLAAAALNSTETTEALATLHRSPALAGVNRRSTPTELDEAVRHSIESETPDLAILWWVTGVRPMAEALRDLGPESRDHVGPVDLLAADLPLPRTLRRLARWGHVSQARTVDVLAIRLRAAIGRLLTAADPVLGRAVARHADTDLLCALVLAVSASTALPEDRLTPVSQPGDVRVPGFPPSTLDDEDGPWRRARLTAEDLGPDLRWDGSPPRLAVPTDWLGPEGWAGLWAGAARHSARRLHAAGLRDREQDPKAGVARN